MADEKELKKPIELDDESLQHVAGGAVDIFLQLDGIKGEETSTQTSAKKT